LLEKQNSHPSRGAFKLQSTAPVRCLSAHTRLIDPTINDALQIVT